MVGRTLTALLALLLTAGAAWAENLIKADIHRGEKLYEDTSFELEISATGRFDSWDLDTRPLAAENFTIGEPRFEYREYQNVSLWTIPLLTHASGQMQIPRLLIRDNVTDPIPINVRRRNGREPRPELRGLIQTEIIRPAGFVNETLLIRTVTTVHGGVELTSPPVSPAVDGDGQIHQLHESREQRSTMGHRYEVITTVHAASFRTPGTHRIIPASARGTYAPAGAQQGNPTITNQGGTIRVTDPSKSRDGGPQVPFVFQEKPIEITVTAPAGNAGAIAADDFKIRETWEPEKNADLKVNTPIVHEITFSGTGISAQDLPSRIIGGTPQYKAYTDKEQISEHYDPETGILESSRTFSQVFVPLRPMKLHFAPEEIRWISRNENNQATLSVFHLESPTYDISADGDEQYDFTARNTTRILLLTAMLLIIALIVFCVLYLLYLENIISIEPLTRWNVRRRARRELLRNFDVRDARNAYRQLIDFARICFGPNATCFEKFPNYQTFKPYLDEIAQKRWDHGKSCSNWEYDGSAFRKVLRKFCRT